MLTTPPFPPHRFRLSNLIALATISIFVVWSLTYWMGGISDPFVRSDQVEIQRFFVDTFPDHWNITMHIRNRGRQGTVITILEVGAATNQVSIPVNQPIASGEEQFIQFRLSHQQFTPDTCVDIKLHTSGGEMCVDALLLPAPQ